MSEVIEGEVKWFNNERGYGFINPVNDDGTVDETNEYFVHFSNINIDGFKTLQTKQRVTCVLVKTDKGAQAHEVTPV